MMSSPPFMPPCTTVHNCLEGAAALYHLLLGQAPPSPPLILPPRTPPQKSSHLQLLPLCQHLNSLQDQKGGFLHQSQWEHAPGQSHPAAVLGGHPYLKSERTLLGSSC